MGSPIGATFETFISTPGVSPMAMSLCLMARLPAIFLTFPSSPVFILLSCIFCACPGLTGRGDIDLGSDANTEPVLGIVQLDNNRSAVMSVFNGYRDSFGDAHFRESVSDTVSAFYIIHFKRSFSCKCQWHNDPSVLLSV